MTHKSARFRTIVLTLAGLCGLLAWAPRANAQEFPRLAARHEGSGTYENRNTKEVLELSAARVVLDSEGRAAIDVSGRNLAISLRGRITHFNGREHVDIVLETFDGLPTNAKGWVALDRRGGIDRIEFDGNTPVRLGISFRSKGPNLEPPPPPPKPPTEAPAGLTEEYGVDRRGSDYRHFESADLRTCQNTCKGDTRCRAYVYNLNRRICYLKSQAPAASNDREVISGVKQGWNGGSGGSGEAGGPGGQGGHLSEERGLDRRGNDYSDFRARNLDDCQDACRRDDRCRAYTFDTVDRSCYLKDRVNSQQRNRDMVTGYKE